ncbi:MAG TPA: sigma-54-dependent Fis family transcriptional regulator [Anaeromyxobacteraceae bacterium]|nr:sigma-54-dependent Fis family transcriptional regulator [Anaeromyxobacteraceae bacterium]
MSQIHRPVHRQERRRATERAWQLFVQDGIEPSGIADEIARSWQRARVVHKIDPGLTRPQRRLETDALLQRCERDEILRLARPILVEFAARLGLADHVIAFFDGNGLMLTIDGMPDVVDAVAEIDFRPGVSWAEDSAGTNGPGTALAERRPVEIFASEHFVHAWQCWSCAAAPVFAPGLAAPAGIVDITGPWEVQRRQALVAAKAIARAIEERLRAACSVRDEVVRYALREAHASGDALVAVDCRGTVVAVNDAAARRRVVEAGALPPLVRSALLRALAGPVGARTELTLDVLDGQRLIVSPISHESALVGAIVRALDPRGSPRPPRGRAASRAGSAARASASSSALTTLARYDFGRILGASDSLARAVGLARIAASNSLPVTLFGESGTGKELFAHAIHAASERRDAPFVAVNCGSIPSQLLEAELFGYQAGTFTGGRSEGNRGRFEDADGGTLFLDEVSELSGPGQTALLRVLQEGEVVRLGGSASRRVNVRIVAATNKPLDGEIRAGRFRRDLYYRLDVLSIDIPPLRQRGEDIALLAEVFLSEAEAEVGRRGLRLTSAAFDLLRSHPWPGNVRELRNVIFRAAATAATEQIGAEDLRLEGGGGSTAPAAGGGGETLRGAVREVERDVLLASLHASDWNVARAAARLGISRMTLYRRLAKLGISRDPPAH